MQRRIFLKQGAFALVNQVASWLLVASGAVVAVGMAGLWILGRIGPIARDHGIRLTIENLNTAETNVCTSIAESVEVITAAGPDVYLTADIYHMMRDDDPAEELRKAKGRLIHCHVAEKELRSAPGTKGDDFRPHLRVLREMGYAGAFSFECGWAKSVSPDKAIAAFRQQLATL